MPAAFDEAELLDRVDHDVGFLRETVEMLVSDGRALMDDVQRAAAAQDAEGLGRAAHALKGMISNFCAAEAYQHAQEVERLGRGGDLSQAMGAVDRLRQGLDALTEQLVAFEKARS